MDSIVQYYDKYPYDNAVESTCKTNTVQFKGLSISFIESHTKHPWNLTHAHTHTPPLTLTLTLSFRKSKISELWQNESNTSNHKTFS